MQITLPSTTTNGVSVPNDDKTTLYIRDAVGGWLYEANINVSVVRTSLPNAQEKLAQARATAAAAVAAADALAVQVAGLEQAAQDQPAEAELP